jgi:hypothetical protein
MRKANIFLILALFCCFYTVASAKDINFQASVDRNKVGLGQSLQLSFTFDNIQDMPALELPELEGFQARYLGPSTSMSIINGRVFSSITHVYTLLPVKVGTFNIGPLKFDYKGDSYSSNALSIEVVQQAAPPQQSQPSASGQLTGTQDLNERMFLIMQAKKNKVYLNEIVPVTIKLFVNKLGVKDIQYPQFIHEGFATGEFQEPKQYQQVIGGVNYDVIEFTTSVFGLKPGEFRLGPANLQCNLIVRKQTRRQAPFSFDDFFNDDVFDDFFGSYQTYPMNLKSADIPLQVLPLPEENRPAGFSQAVGNFNVEATANPAQVKTGDPITLKLVIRGEGNFNTVKMPDLGLGDDFKTYEPQVKQEKDAKTFEQVLIPLNADIKEIPIINFSFFNQQTGQYETISRGPFPVKISKLAKEEEQKIIENKEPLSSVQEEKFGRDILYIKNSPGQLRKKGGYLYKSKIFLGFQIVPLLFYVLVALTQARRRRLKTDVRYARQLLAPRKARAGILRARGYLDKGLAQEFYDCLFATLQEYLGDKFHLPSKGITISILDEQLKHKNLSPDALTKLRDIFSECDMVRYAASQLTREDMQSSLKKLEEVIDYLQRGKV